MQNYKNNVEVVEDYEKCSCIRKYKISMKSLSECERMCVSLLKQNTNKTTNTTFSKLQIFFGCGYVSAFILTIFLF